MKFVILDVGHGGCAYAQDSNGSLLVVDCGHRPEVCPSLVLPGQSIQRFFVSNYDEDHVSDLPSVRRDYSVEVLHRNKSITAQQLRALKLEGGPISRAMESMLEMMSSYTGEVTNATPFPNISWANYCNRYGSDFLDTNNISLVSFLNVNGLHVVLPGDVETKGWELLLENPSVQRELRSVSVFVASHHGRESGYCAEVFEYCSPSVVVFSDGPKKFATQEMANTYAQHASGIPFNGQTRYVLTTRNDGTLTWNR